MEEESARFGVAVGLDSASTFECIVDRDRHYFMEVNTRIQVEHRVSEINRFGAAAEARLNATDASLSPSAGGMIRYWTKPLEGEIRDDQGICMPNPDSGQFMRYKVAGAYDSNIALLLTTGVDRIDSYNSLRPRALSCPT
jgi:acetyl/propionyl-CoA carboxylase alpha subunit